MKKGVLERFFERDFLQEEPQYQVEHIIDHAYNGKTDNIIFLTKYVDQPDYCWIESWEFFGYEVGDDELWVTQALADYCAQNNYDLEILEKIHTKEYICDRYEKNMHRRESYYKGA